MHYSEIIQTYRKLRLSVFQGRTQLAVVYKIMLAIGMACATGFLAQVKFFLPWTPVPVVASQVGVVLAAVLLGRKWGGASMIIYAAAGFAGIPWLAGYNGGLSALFGPTSGYVFGFILAALFIGHVIDSSPRSRRILPLLGIILFAQLVLVYVPGLIQLAAWLHFVQGSAFSISGLLWMGYIPFIAGDIVKSLVLVGLIKTVLPMEDYSNR